VCASEAESATTADEWERRTRIVSGANDVLWRRRQLLVPGKSPVTAQLWGHRLFSPITRSAGARGPCLDCSSLREKSHLARGFLARTHSPCPHSFASSADGQTGAWAVCPLRCSSCRRSESEAWSGGPAVIGPRAGRSPSAVCVRATAQVSRIPFELEVDGRADVARDDRGRLRQAPTSEARSSICPRSCLISETSGVSLPCSAISPTMKLAGASPTQAWS